MSLANLEAPGTRADLPEGVPAPEPLAVVAETARGSDKVLNPTPFRITSLDLGLRWRATTVGGGLWAAARACAEEGSTCDEDFTPAEDALMVMLLAGANPCRRNVKGELPMHWAESASAVKILADVGGLETVNGIDQRGCTPLHWAATMGHTPKAKMLIKLGADLLLRDQRKNTPADCARLSREHSLHEILKWAAKRQASGAVIPAGGLLGESTMDRKARVLRDDAEFARWKRAKPVRLHEGTFDRAKSVPAHMQLGIWNGSLPKYVDDPKLVDKALSRHLSYWTTEQVALWIATDPVFAGFGGNAVDFNRRITQCKVTGRHLAYLHPTTLWRNDPIAQFLGMFDVAPREKKIIVAALGQVLKRQKGLAPAAFRDAVDRNFQVVDMIKKGARGDAMLRREAQRLDDYNLLVLPVAVGDRASFRLIGSIEVTPLTSLRTVWQRLTGDPDLGQQLADAGNAAFGQGNPASFWLVTPKDNRRLCLVSADNEELSEEKRAMALAAAAALAGSKEGGGQANGSGNGDGDNAEDGEDEADPAQTLAPAPKMTRRQIADASQFIDMGNSCHAHCYPLLLVCPARAEALRGVEWTGTRMLRQWIEPDKLKMRDEAWKLAHRYKIEGFEAKKKWAERERVAEIQRAEELKGKKMMSPTRKKKTSNF